MEERIKMMLSQLNEMQKRLFLASEALSYGRGGIAEVIRINTGFVNVGLDYSAASQRTGKGSRWQAFKLLLI